MTFKTPLGPVVPFLKFVVQVLEALNRAMGADTEDDLSVYTDCVSESSGSPGIDRREDNQVQRISDYR